MTDPVPCALSGTDERQDKKDSSAKLDRRSDSRNEKSRLASMSTADSTLSLLRDDSSQVVGGMLIHGDSRDNTTRSRMSVHCELFSQEYTINIIAKVAHGIVAVKIAISSRYVHEIGDFTKDKGQTDTFTPSSSELSSLVFRLSSGGRVLHRSTAAASTSIVHGDLIEFCWDLSDINIDVWTMFEARFCQQTGWYKPDRILCKVFIHGKNVMNSLSSSEDKPVHSIHDKKHNSILKLILTDSDKALQSKIKDTAMHISSAINSIEKNPTISERLDRCNSYITLVTIFCSSAGELFPAAKPALLAVQLLSTHLKELKDLDNSILQLLENMSIMLPALDFTQNQVKNDHTKKAILDIIEMIQEASTFASQYIFKGFLNKAMDSETKETFTQFKNRFTRMKDNYDRFIQMETLSSILSIEDLIVLKELHPSSADYDYNHICLEGTRTNILHNLIDWSFKLSDSTQQNIFWLTGLAGSGKSSIAGSFARKLEDSSSHVAMFFCKHDNPDLRDPKRILPTIAFKMAKLYQPYAKLLIMMLHAYPMIAQESLQRQYQFLFQNIFQNPEFILPILPWVFIIDALDECDHSDSQKQLVKQLFNLSELSSEIRIMVTSRPSDHIIRSFTSDKKFERVIHEELHASDAFDDIVAFTRYCLQDVTQVHSLLSHWCNETNINLLAHKANGLFIWTRVITDYLREEINPIVCLQQILNGTPNESSEKELDTLYNFVLDHSINQTSSNQAILRIVLGTIAAVSKRSLLSIENIAKLSSDHITRDMVQFVIQHLQAVLYLQNGVISVCHPSFLDFLTTNSRCRTVYWVNIGAENAKLSLNSLQVIIDGLKFNICNLRTSYTSNKDLDNLDMLISNNIGSLLSYCSKYWADHLYAADMNEMQMNSALKLLNIFISSPVYLYWLEVVSLLNCVSSAIYWLPLVAEKFLNVSQHTYQNLMDIYHFVHSFAQPITVSVPHIYLSAIIWTPKNSLIQHTAKKWFNNRLDITIGQELEWPQTLLVCTLKSFAACVAYSPGGDTIACGCLDGSIYILDAKTGVVEFEMFNPTQHFVRYVSFSTDGQRLVTASNDSTLCVWDLKSGSLLHGPLYAHSGWIGAAIYSIDNEMILSCSGDKTVRLWNPESGTCIFDTLSVHNASIRAIAISSNGSMFATGSEDQTIIVWSLQTRSPLYKPFQNIGKVRSICFDKTSSFIAAAVGEYVLIWEICSQSIVYGPIKTHRDQINCIIYNADCTAIISAADDKNIYIWDIENRDITQPSYQLVGHTGAVRSISLAPDGKHLVSSSADKTICIWNTQLADIYTGSPLLLGHTDKVRSVAISPLKTHAISASEDGTLYIWDLKTASCFKGPILHHTEQVRSVKYSPDGKYVTSSSADKTICMWNALTGELKYRSSQIHTNWINGISYSPNGKYFVSASADRTICIWNSDDLSVVMGPLVGHKAWVRAIEFSPDGKQILSGAEDGTIAIWDATSGKQLVPTHKVHQWSITGLSYSPKGDHFATSSTDLQIHIRDTKTAKLVMKPLIGHRDWVYSVVYSPDGNYLISGSADTTVGIWDSVTGAQIGSLPGHTHNVKTIAVSSDMSTIISGSDDRTIRVWDFKAFIDECMKKKLETINVEENNIVQWELNPKATKLCKPVDNDGWVRTPDGGLLLWVPQQYRHGVFDKAVLTLPQEVASHSVVLDCTRFCHGEEWANIKSDNSV